MKPNLIGEDFLGNRYFEVPADPSRGKRRPRRWYTSAVSNYHDPRGSNIISGFDNELPSEWESWLRFRREVLYEFLCWYFNIFICLQVPPTDAQVMQSYAIADLKKVLENIAKVIENDT